MEIPARGDSRTRRFAAWQANVAALSAADLTGPSIEPSVAATASDHASTGRPRSTGQVALGPGTQRFPQS